MNTYLVPEGLAGGRVDATLATMTGLSRAKCAELVEASSACYRATAAFWQERLIYPMGSARGRSTSATPHSPARLYRSPLAAPLLPTPPTHRGAESAPPYP